MTPTMESLTSIEPSPDHIIRDLHRIREAIVESFGGDLHALTADAQRRLKESGRPIWRPQPSDNALRNGNSGAADVPTGGS